MKKGADNYCDDFVNYEYHKWNGDFSPLRAPKPNRISQRSISAEVLNEIEAEIQEEEVSEEDLEKEGDKR